MKNGLLEKSDEARPGTVHRWKSGAVVKPETLKAFQPKDEVRTVRIRTDTGVLLVSLAEASKSDKGSQPPSDMTISNLKQIVRDAEQLLDVLEPATELMGWAEDKVTQAKVAVDSVKNYVLNDFVEEDLDEKIQVPTSPKGRAAFSASLGGWSKAASKVAGSYKDKLMQANSKEIEDQALLDADLGSVSKLLAVIAGRAERLKKK